MFHVKQKILIQILVPILLILTYGEVKHASTDLFELSQTSDVRDTLNYRFRMFAVGREVGFVSLKLSSSTVHEWKYMAEIESYTDVPIFLISAKTKAHEIEFYDADFTPLRSTLVTLTKDSNIISTVDTYLVTSSDPNIKSYVVRKKTKRSKEVYLTSDGIILTAGNAIPVVSSVWDFKKEKSITFKFIDKQFLRLNTLTFEYKGKTEDGINKIELRLSYPGAKFLIYVDDEKNIKSAEGMGLTILPE